MSADRGHGGQAADPDLVERCVAEAVAAATTDRRRLVSIIRILSETPAPHGAEERAARALSAWGQRSLPDLRFMVDVFDGARANLTVEGGSGLGPDFGFASHLDTLLSGDSRRDSPITGRGDALPSVRAEGDELIGHGLAVPRGPAASALVALIAASGVLTAAGVDHRLRLLLASGGTHRWPPGHQPGGAGRFGVGARRALATGFGPQAVVTVDAGAPAPLHEEPGAAYLSIVVTAGWGRVEARGASAGTMSVIAPVLTGVERWRSSLQRRPVPEGSTSGREAALGALWTGVMDKPDLLPALIRARVFVVTAPGDDIGELAAELQETIDAAINHADIHLPNLRVTVGVDAAEYAERTDPAAPLVTISRQAWGTRWGRPADITGWRDSGNGLAFRAAGIPTVRIGPIIPADDTDPRLDRLRVQNLLAFAGLYAEIAVRWIFANSV